MSSPAEILAEAFKSVLEDKSGFLVRRIWPDNSGLGSLREALCEARSVGSSEDSGEDLYEKMSRHLSLLGTSLPVLAIAGLINAGKSSVTASFLSPGGRARVLCGLGSDEATQRFVIWCPRSWETDVLRYDSLREILAAVFGAKLEKLSENAPDALRQYNTGERFNVPLIGFDEGLDAANFAILDCPDVERKAPGAEGEHTSQLRLDVLKKASAIASALLIVASHAGFAAEDFESMLRAVLAEMPGIRWWFLLNMCDPQYEPHRVYAECIQLADSQKPKAEGVFIAYNFNYDAEEWRRCTPLALHGLRTPDRLLRLPAFYLAEPDAARNPPNPVEEARFLPRICRELDTEAGVGRRLYQMHSKRLIELSRMAENETKLFCEKTSESARRLWEGLLRVCSRSYMDASGQLIIPLTPETAKRLKNALIDTAPILARMQMKTALGVGIIVGWTVAVPKWILKKVQIYFNRNEAGHVQKVPAKLEAKIFIDEMIREGFALSQLPADARVDFWNRVLSQFMKHRPEELDLDDLKSAMTEVWKLRGSRQKVREFAPLIIFITVLIAFAMAPVDGGALLSTLLAKMGISGLVTFKVGILLAHHVVGFLSVSEILFTLGLTAAVAPVGGFELEKQMRDRLALPALANLFACACDAFGLPRRIGSDPMVKIKAQDFAVPPPTADRGQIECALLKESVWEFQPGGWRCLIQRAEALNLNAEKKSENEVLGDHEN